MRLSVGALAAVLLGMAPGPAAAQQASAAMQLLRCSAAASAGCLWTRLPLASAEAKVAGAVDSAAEATAWSGQLAGQRLGGPGLGVPARVVPPLRLFVLYDVSGSMVGDGIAFTRVALASFLAGLDSASVRVAVAPFESRSVAARIRAAQFVPPGQAVDIVRQIPAPDRAGNTGLYSALVEAVRAIDAQVVRDSGARGALLLMSEGGNDVGYPRDDQGLLAGASGLAAAQAEVRRAGYDVWIIGMGDQVAVAELQSLAGADGSVTIAALDPAALGTRLAAIGRQLRSERELVFGVPGGLAGSLARSARSGAATFSSPSGGEGVRRALAWRPPLVALPAYEGVVAAGALPRELADAVGTGEGGLSSRWLVALVLVGAGCLLWLVIPRLVWVTAAPVGAPARSRPREKSAPPPEPAPSGGATAPAKSASAEAGAPVKPGAVRGTVTESAPRRPDQVTAQSARRLKTQ